MVAARPDAPLSTARAAPYRCRRILLCRAAPCRDAPPSKPAPRHLPVLLCGLCRHGRVFLYRAAPCRLHTAGVTQSDPSVKKVCILDRRQQNVSHQLEQSSMAKTAG
ncbi:hypothetical protein BDA96_04G154600 [Sorghum bicolor]|uniref:Uncharacterized protein n=2 Tax=Sorghum bicolor TaxID=4558 RepID=A0A921UJ41_SORBI|nr:hypothetical protein BDA96_04G154600 [Sorghum bicolor]KXG30200.1 hypothetical protein SORBI_3004G144800 [Sorghum bicolor]